MRIRHDSVHFHILVGLCAMPKAVRGMAPTMLERRYGDLGAAEELAAAGFLKKRGWADGPGWIWVPTEAGEALHASMSEALHQSPTVTTTDRVILPDHPVRTQVDQRSS